MNIVIGRHRRKVRSIPRSIHRPIARPPRVTQDYYRVPEIDARWVIGVPAWTRPYVSLAVKHTIPATIAAIEYWKPECPPAFVIHTDDEGSFKAVLKDYPTTFMPLRFDNSKDSNWVAFKNAHRDILNMTQQGAIAVMLNSDIVVSREAFAVADRALSPLNKKVVVSVGIRSLVTDSTYVPIGASAEALAGWAWEHRHSITRGLTWGEGNSRHPTIVYFTHSDGDVSMHCFHLTPMWIKKDRHLKFLGTIDDDVLSWYSEDELFFANNGEFFVAELSRAYKVQSCGPTPMTVDMIVDFAKQRIQPPHVRNFLHRFPVVGRPKKNHDVADRIIDGLVSAFNTNNLLRLSDLAADLRHRGISSEREADDASAQT